MDFKEEPPDKYRCIKMPLRKILHKGKRSETLKVINDAVRRTNHIITKAYLLLRLWVLEKYHNDEDIPKITTDTIKMATKSLKKQTVGRPPNTDNLLLLAEFQILQRLNSIPLEEGEYLSIILNYYSTTILTAIENNIRMHFINHLKRFVNSYFKALYKDQITNSVFKKQLYKELNVVKNDLINDTLTCDSKYHQWLKTNRYKIVPQDYDTNYYYDLKANPQRYLKHMIYMNLELESIESKLFQFFPLQTQIIPRHIQIDTKALSDLFIHTNTKQYNTQLSKHKVSLWKQFFNITQTLNKHVFDYTIITDGHSVSLRFLHEDYVVEEQTKKDNKREGREKLTGLTAEQMEHNKKEKQAQQEQIQKEEKLKRQLENQRQKELGIKDPKLKLKPNPNPKSKHEFLYIDEVPQVNLQGKHVFIDPGKRTLLTMMDDNGNFYSYTNRQRITSTKRLKYQTLLKNHKDKLGITIKENTLSSLNSKTCQLDNFKNYIKKKLQVNEELYSLYEHKKFRKYKLYSYINTRRTEDNMLNLIEKKFGSDAKIIMGDWSIGKQMRNFISTPNLTIKRKLETRFPVYNIDEFRTSCLHYKTEGFCKNLYLPDNNNVTRKQHSILTYQMENQRTGCLNRDKNACKNMQKIFNSYMATGHRPEKYRRDYNFEPNISTIQGVGLSNGIMPQGGALQTPLGKKSKILLILKNKLS